MAYFVYLIEQPSGGNQEPVLLDQFDHFVEAKNYARQQRAELASQQPAASSMVKMVFAENALEGASLLKQKREPPIQKEWEK